MPIQFAIEPSGGTVLTTALGIVSGREVLAHLEAKTRAEVIHCNELFDARDVTLDVSTSELIAIAKAVRDALRGRAPGKSAVVTDSPIIYTLAKTYVDMTGKETSDLQVFKDMSSAREWLGLDSGEESVGAVERDTVAGTAVG